MGAKRLAKLALFQHEPYCSRDCCAGIIAALTNQYEITVIGLSDLTLRALKEFDLIIFPGGRGEAAQFHAILRNHISIIHSYLDQGGRYLGICMGAYWADAYYFNVLKNIRCAQYIKRPQAEIRRSYPTLARINWDHQIQKMYFFDGCTFTGDFGETHIIATYANGDPMAILQNSVGLIGCHPESEAHWYHSKALKSAWHEYRHHQLLQNFVERMFEFKPKISSSLFENDNPKLKTAKKALDEIVELTAPFGQGTYKKVNYIARNALSHMIKSN
jgi:glutamine amidotransferase-like uncharacterized protein